MALKKTADVNATTDATGAPVEAKIYEKEFIVTRRVDIVSLRRRRAELQKELDEIDNTINEIVKAEA